MGKALVPISERTDKIKDGERKHNGLPYHYIPSLSAGGLIITGHTKSLKHKFFFIIQDFRYISEHSIFH